MKQLLFIHPLGQACAFVFGLFNAITGVTRRCFILPIHVNCGAMYYFIVFFGAVMGSVMAQWARTKGIPIDMNLHKSLAMVMVMLIAAGATTGIVMIFRNAQRARLLRYHRWINLISLALFVAQAVSGGLVALQLYRT